MRGHEAFFLLCLSLQPCHTTTVPTCDAGGSVQGSDLSLPAVRLSLCPLAKGMEDMLLRVAQNIRQKLEKQK